MLAMVGRRCDWLAGCSECCKCDAGEIRRDTEVDRRAGCPTCWCDAGELSWIVADDKAGLWVLTCCPGQPQPLYIMELSATAHLSVASCLTCLPEWQAPRTADRTSGQKSVGLDWPKLAVLICKDHLEWLLFR